MSDTKFCPKCERALPAPAFNRDIGRRDGLSVYCTTCYREYAKEMRVRRKLEVFAHLGGACAHCGFDDPRALQIDHRDGDGVTHRKTSNPTKFYAEVMADDGTRFQLLCANCNWIKMFEEGERGNRVYTRLPPLEGITKRASRRWTPEMRERQAQQATERWSDPDMRARMSEGRSERMKHRWASGEVPNKPRENSQ